MGQQWLSGPASQQGLGVLGDGHNGAAGDGHALAVAGHGQAAVRVLGGQGVRVRASEDGRGGARAAASMSSSRRILRVVATVICPPGICAVAATVSTAAAVTLRQGMVIDPERGLFGGLPEVLRPDNRLEFAAGAIRRSCAALGIEPARRLRIRATARARWSRVNRTLDQEFLSGLPFYTHGPRAADGRLYGPDAEPMGLGLFCDRFAEWLSGTTTPLSRMRYTTMLGSAAGTRGMPVITPSTGRPVPGPPGRGQRVVPPRSCCPGRRPRQQA